MRFGENVRELREERDWTQENLAEKASLDQTYISGIERGERNLTVISIVKLEECVSGVVICDGTKRANPWTVFRRRAGH